MRLPSWFKMTLWVLSFVVPRSVYGGTELPIERYAPQPLPGFPSKLGPETLELRLRSPKSVYVNEWPRFEAVITNRGKRPVSLVQPVDGSILGWRSPITGWSVLRLEGMRAKHPRFPLESGLIGCPTLSPIEMDYRFVLKPGESRQLRMQWAGLYGLPSQYRTTGTVAGKYSIVFYYANVPELGWEHRDLIPPVPNWTRAAQGTTPCALMSNAVTLEVKDRK
jgi:hypothetical protein